MAVKTRAFSQVIATLGIVWSRDIVSTVEKGGRWPGVNIPGPRSQEGPEKRFANAKNVI